MKKDPQKFDTLATLQNFLLSALPKQKYKILLSVLKCKNHLWEYSPEIQAKQEQ